MNKLSAPVKQTCAQELTKVDPRLEEVNLCARWAGLHVGFGLFAGTDGGRKNSESDIPACAEFPFDRPVKGVCRGAGGGSLVGSAPTFI